MDKKHIHSPRLDTIAMVENTIKKSKEKLSKTELWKKLPKQMMYQTFSTAIDYLIELKKIKLNEEGKIEWLEEKKEGITFEKKTEEKKEIEIKERIESVEVSKIDLDENTKKTVSELSEIERKALNALNEKKELSVQELSEKAGIELDSARRAIQWMNEKGLGKARIEKQVFVFLGEEGLKALKTGLPEKNFLKELSEQWKGLSEIKSIPKQEINIAVGNAKKKDLIELKKEKELMIKITEKGKEFLNKKTEEELMLEKISENELEEKNLNEKEKNVLKFLGFRKNFLKHKEKGNEFILITEKGINASGWLREEKKTKTFSADAILKRKYNIQGPVQEVFPGKKQPYFKFVDEIKQKLVSLGFKEMDNPLIVQEFYNFDVLFQPQNHPARTWTDTYKLKKPVHGKLPDKKIVQSIKNAHENGGKAKSKGWKYEWNERIATQLMPSAHGTAHSARQLVKGVEVPGKYFTLARCFRPDVVDATHLIEFNQMEGFVVGKDFTFRKLLGLLKEFATEIAGAEKVKFLPDYYPFTEPSVQLNALHPTLGWVEFGGAGIFRAEITENLGIKEKCLAWGLGMDRLAMFKLQLNDIRELFSQNLDWMRKGI